ncbi:MAG: hypothetical protein AB7U35_00980 [Sphingobium sp.]
MKLPKRLPYEILILGALALGSCDKLPHSFTGEDYDQLDVADVNARNAIYRVDALESRVSEIESRLNI